MVVCAIQGGLPVIVPANAKSFLVRRLPGVCCLAPVDGGFGKLLPGRSLDGVGDSVYHDLLHVIFGSKTTPRWPWHQPTWSRDQCRNSGAYLFAALLSSNRMCETTVDMG